MSSETAAIAAANDKAFLGHPRGLSTLFFTEMWERFSYYGVRTLLVLYVIAPIDSHGLGLPERTAYALYGLFGSAAYLFSLPTGWIADRFIGHQKAVILGGLLISLGNFGILIPSAGTLLLALMVKAIGTAFLKTSCTTVVGFLYSQGDRRRDAGFTLYYVGINVGAFLAPLACGTLGQKVDYRLGFLLAGVFMLAGLAQFMMTRKYLGDAGAVPTKPPTARDRKLLWTGIGVLAATAAGLALWQVPIETIDNGFLVVLIVSVLFTFGALILSKDFTATEKKRIYVILVLFIASALFWGIFEQAGSTLTVFAEQNTLNRLFGYDYPSTWFQSLNPILIWGFGPLLAWLWLKLKDRDPGLITKFALGLFGAGAGFLLMTFAARAANGGQLVSPLWLIGVYVLHTLGELCLSPVGQSAISKLAPTRIAGMVMGVWFMSVSVGNFAAGRLGSLSQSISLEQMVTYAGTAAVALGVILLLISKPVTRLMGGVK